MNRKVLPLWLHGLTSLVAAPLGFAVSVALFVWVYQVSVSEQDTLGLSVWLVGLSIGCLGWLAPGVYLRRRGEFSTRQERARQVSLRGLRSRFDSHWRPNQFYGGVGFLAVGFTLPWLIVDKEGFTAVGLAHV